jgi:hypothetical protein
MPPKLFRQIPPLDVVVSVLTGIGLSGITDTRLFSLEDIKLDTITTWAPLLEPYYLPCKAKRYFDPLDNRRIITILRHLLPLHGFRLQTYERNYNGKKRTVYQIHPATPRTNNVNQEVQVLFL